MGALCTPDAEKPVSSPPRELHVPPRDPRTSVRNFRTPPRTLRAPARAFRRRRHLRLLTGSHATRSYSTSSTWIARNLLDQSKVASNQLIATFPPVATRVRAFDSGRVVADMKLASVGIACACR